MTTTDRETINHGKVCPDCGSDEWHVRGSIRCEQRELARLRKTVAEMEASWSKAKNETGAWLSWAAKEHGSPLSSDDAARGHIDGGIRFVNEARVRLQGEKMHLHAVALEAAAMLAETNHGGLSWNRKESMRLALEAAGVEIPKQCERCPHTTGANP